MKTITYLSLILFFVCAAFKVQGQTNYLLKAEGKIPKEFITSSTEKFKKEVKNLKKKKKKKKRKNRRQRKDQKKFLLESGFAIDDILQSGLVLFNDPTTNYVNKVLEQLPIKDRRLIRKNPRAYVLNSSAVNAFATDQGIIFVTLGLLANLENEAQLAFILSHELIHIREKHSINKFIRSKDIDRNNKKGDKNIDKIGVDKNIFKKSMYSRKLEEEADESGLDIFSATQYDPQAIINTFKMLHYSYLPFEEIKFEKSFFEDESYIFSDALWLSEVNKISPMETEEDKSASHPSSNERLQKLKSSINVDTKSSKAAFIVSESEFRTVQALARYQLPFLNLNTEDFPQAIYTSYLLLQNDPNNLALKKVIGKSLYMEAKYQNYDAENGQGRKQVLKEIAKEVEGVSQQVYHLLAQMTAKEITILATKYNWKLYQQNPEEEELKLIIDDLFIEFANNFETLDEFSTAKSLPSTKAAIEQKSRDTTQSLKVDKIDKANQESKYWKYAFVTELKDSSFHEQYQTGLTKVKKALEREEYYESEEGKKAYKKSKKRETKKGKKLGIKKIVVVNPFYLSINESKDGGTIQFIRSEKKQAYFRNAINDISKISKLDATVLDVTNLSDNEIEKFNDISEINDYFSQQINHSDLSLTPGYNQSKVNKIAEKYDTPYFLWTGVISLKESSSQKWMGVAISVLMPYALPLTLYSALTPDYDMLYYAILFDVNTGKRSILKMDYFNKKDSKAILRSHIYDVFHQINIERKED